MRAVFSSLVAASLLIHAAIGCCWHHAHDAECGNEACAEQTASTDGGQHDDCDSSSGHGDHHAPCKGHCEGTCHYLSVQKTQVEVIAPHLPLDFAAVIPATCDVHVAALVHAERSYESVAEPPLRLHLLHQILLI